MAALFDDSKSATWVSAGVDFSGFSFVRTLLVFFIEVFFSTAFEVGFLMMPISSVDASVTLPVFAVLGLDARFLICDFLADGIFTDIGTASFFGMAFLSSDLLTEFEGDFLAAGLLMVGAVAFFARAIFAAPLPAVQIYGDTIVISILRRLLLSSRCSGGECIRLDPYK